MRAAYARAGATDTHTHTLARGTETWKRGLPQDTCTSTYIVETSFDALHLSKYKQSLLTMQKVGMYAVWCLTSPVWD